MSVEALNWALKQKTGSSSRKAVLITLANYANASGECYPSHETLAELTELTVRGVQLQLKALQESGLISWENRRNAHGKTSNLYQLNMAEVREPRSGTLANHVRVHPEPRSLRVSEPRSYEPLVLKEDLNTNDTVVRVFEYWQQKFNRQKAILDTKRRSKIQLGLKHFHIDDLFKAIDAAAVDPFTLGQNDRATKYDDLVTIFRDVPKIESWLQEKVAPVAVSAQPNRQAIIDACSYCTDKGIIQTVDEHGEVRVKICDHTDEMKKFAQSVS